MSHPLHSDVTLTCLALVDPPRVLSLENGLGRLVVRLAAALPALVYSCMNQNEEYVDESSKDSEDCPYACRNVEQSTRAKHSRARTLSQRQDRAFLFGAQKSWRAQQKGSSKTILVRSRDCAPLICVMIETVLLHRIWALPSPVWAWLILGL
jgi:hypothetical protein